MANEHHPQNTALLCTGLNLPKLNQLTSSTSGETNLIPRYSPIVVPKISQKAAVPKYQSVIFESFGLTAGRFCAFFLAGTNVVSLFSFTLLMIPLLSSASYLPLNSSFDKL